MSGMDLLEDLRARLNADDCKGTGRWAEIAKRADCHYFTVARIARGVLTNPGLKLVNRLCDAIKATEPTADHREAA
jgi:hypothetical protein